MQLKMKKVTDQEFRTFGRILEGYNFQELIEELESATEQPKDRVIYVASDDKLEKTTAYQALKENCYGGMPIQIGYCNGRNTKLNCLEYHRDSEIDIAADDIILLLARQQDIIDDELDTSKVEAFFCPKGTAVELYATTLHYAPCSAKKDEGFRVIIVLPDGTNEEKPALKIRNKEDEKLFARNKWLLAHPEAEEVSAGAFVGLKGENIDISYYSH